MLCGFIKLKKQPCNVVYTDFRPVPLQHYIYPHDYPNHWVEQQYLPDDLKKRKYYVYQDNKFEQALKEYWDKVKK